MGAATASRLRSPRQNDSRGQSGNATQYFTEARDRHPRLPLPISSRSSGRPRIEARGRDSSRSQDFAQTDSHALADQVLDPAHRRHRYRAGSGARRARRDSCTRPVRSLTTAAENVTATGDLTERVEVSGHDELGRLARASTRCSRHSRNRSDANGGWSRTPRTNCGRRSPRPGRTSTCCARDGCRRKRQSTPSTRQPSSSLP